MTSSAMSQVVWTLGGAIGGWCLMALQGSRYAYDPPLVAYVIAVLLGGVAGFVIGRGLTSG